MPMQELMVDKEDEKTQMQNKEINKQEVLEGKEKIRWLKENKEGEEIQEIEEETLCKTEDGENDNSDTELSKTKYIQNMTSERVFHIFSFIILSTWISRTKIYTCCYFFKSRWVTFLILFANLF